MRTASEHSVQIALVVARPITGSPLLVLLGEPRSFALLLSRIMLLSIFDEAALPFARRPLPFALNDTLFRLCGWCFVQLLYEARVRARPVLSLGVH